MSANMSVMLAELLEANAALSESTPDLPTSCLQNRFRLHKPCATERLQRINVFLTYTPWHLFFCLTAIFDAEGRRERERELSSRQTLLPCISRVVLTVLHAVPCGGTDVSVKILPGIQ